MPQSLADAGRAALPLMAIVLVVILGAALVRRFAGRRSQAPRTGRWQRQLTFVGLVVVAVLAVALLLPVDADTRNQLIGLIGLAITGIIAVSSTTFVTNAMAGLMLRALDNFGPGDWVAVDDQLGRVTEQGLLHTEIQTEDRDLTTIPNLFMVTQPVKVIAESGTIISATVSLGYDLPRTEVTALLNDAAETVGLEESFVQVTELGDFSVTYRVGGLLTDVSSLAGARSRLRGAMMDVLHEAGLEIVSPTFMNQRPSPSKVLPSPDDLARGATGEVPHEAPPDVAFDKAQRAAQAALVEELIEERREGLAEAKKSRDADAAHRLEAEIRSLEALLPPVDDGD